jgi:hypothetical protein
MGEPWPERVRQALHSPPRILFHATTPKKIARYRANGAILPPVRGFDTEAAAKEWARLHGRRIVLRVPVKDAQALPDHHLAEGLAWWTPHPVPVDSLLLPDEPAC